MENLDKYIEQLKPLLAKVGEKVGEGAQFGWQIMIRQQYVIVAQNILGVTFGLIGLFLAYKIYGWGKNYTPDNSLDDSAFFIYALAFCVSVGATAAVIICSIIAISHAINPAYYALQDIIKLVK